VKDVDTEKQAELVRLYIRADEEANALHAQATFYPVAPGAGQGWAVGR
jgi:hypothetical protein